MRFPFRHSRAGVAIKRWAIAAAEHAAVRRYAREIAPRADIVHFDCNPADILAIATRITGIIDWDGWCAGDRMLDVAAMLFYSYADSAESKQDTFMRTIRMISRKYDGALRDDYEAFLYAEDNERLVVYAPVGTMSYDRHVQAWVAAPDGLLEIYFKSRWYNVWHICEQIGNTNQIYCNLSMPAVRTASSIEWVDLDLDYRVHLDGRLERLDEDEYLAHIASMGYPPEVQAQVQAACVEIEALYHQRADPFNHAEQVALYGQIKAREGKAA